MPAGRETVTDNPPTNGALDTCLVIGPNASLSTRAAVSFMAGICTVSLGIGMTFALLGYWPVLPFAGLELAALGAALTVSMRRSRYREVVRFRGDAIGVEVGELGRGVGRRLQFKRSATRVLIERGPHATSPTRLLLSCGAQRLELGRCLTDDEREQLGARMRELIHPGWPRGSAAAVLPGRY
jgi:uncharacterized membrane protein